jgi:hypothetical protein
MALISDNHPALADNQRKYWDDELKNTKILLADLNQLIFKLEHEEIKAYGMDTGQNNISTTRQDLPSLIDRREKLIKQIKDFEDMLGINQLPEKQKMFQAVPQW